MNKDEPAFPFVLARSTWHKRSLLGGDEQSGSEQSYSPGLTKREAFAMAAMQGLLGTPNPANAFKSENVAAVSVRYADALLAELAK